MHGENINTLYELVRRRGTALLICFLALTAVSFFLVTGDAAGAGRLDEITGGSGILDSRFGYSEDEARGYFSQLGESGRVHLLFAVIPLDMLFLLSYTALLIIAVIKAVLLTAPPGRYPHRLRFLLAVPLAAGLADLLENLSQVLILLSFPDIPSGMLSLLVFATPAKFILAAAALVLLLRELISAFADRFRKV